jgi:ubiquinone/menaquinone biosynthesis C-methylase UbiE
MRRPTPLSARAEWAWLQTLPLRRRRLRRMLALMDGRTSAGGTLVDVGGGIGVGAEEALRVAPVGAYARVVELDPQRAMLVRGTLRRKTHPLPTWLCGSGAHLPLADGSADLLLSFGVLCCMAESDVPRAISELYRVARPGGYCLLGVPRSWASFTGPLFRSAGFRWVAELRPGRALYERPAGRPPARAGEA